VGSIGGSSETLQGIQVSAPSVEVLYTLYTIHYRRMSIQVSAHSAEVLYTLYTIHYRRMSIQVSAHSAEPQGGR
jgi:hypothetical protein